MSVCGAEETERKRERDKNAAESQTRAHLGRFLYSSVGELQFPPSLPPSHWADAGRRGVTALWAPFALLITIRHARRFVIRSVFCETELPIIIIRPIAISLGLSYARERTTTSPCGEGMSAFRAFRDRAIYGSSVERDR